jgi:lysophospholipase L1-like esterase
VTFSRRPNLPQHNRGRIPAGGGSSVEAFSVVAHGNSLTRGFGATDPATTSYPPVLQGLLGSPPSTVYREGTDGAATGILVNNFVSQIGSIYPTGSRRVYVGWEIGNDLLAGSTEAAALLAYKRLCGMALAWGFHVVACTVPPRADLVGADDTERQNINTSIVANYAQYAHALANIGAAANLQNTADATYFQVDGVHLKDAGYAAVAAAVQPAITPALAGTITDYPTVITGNTNSAAFFDAREEFRTIATGVSAWFDRWGGVSHSQAGGGSQPAYNATGWNSASPVLTFDGANDFFTLSTASLANRINGTDVPWTIAGAVRFAGHDVMLTGWDNTGANQRTLIYTTAGGALRVIRRDDAGTTTTHTGTATLGTTRHSIVISFSPPTTVRIWIDGVEDTVGVSGGALTAMTFNRVIVGVYGGGNWMNGDIAELFMAATAWGPTEVARYHAYLQSVRGGL